MKTTREELERLETLLDNQYESVVYADPELKNMAEPYWLVYTGMIRVIEESGFTWRRNKEGKHKIY